MPKKSKTDRFIVEILPPAPTNRGNPDPWVHISILKPTRSKPRMKYRESGYKPQLLDRTEGVREEKKFLAKLAKHIGRVILDHSNNAKKYAIK